MATVQAPSSAVVQGQARSARTTTGWPPPSSGLMHTRPWRSSPLAGPVLSNLPPVIPEASEESHEGELSGPDNARELPRTRPPSSSSIASLSGSLSAPASGYASRNASGSALVLGLAEGEASTSSVSLAASTTAYSSSQGHGSSQSLSIRSARLTKSWGRHMSSSQDDLPQPPSKASDVSITPPPRARTLSHGHSRSVSLPVQSLAPSPTIPQAYSRSSPTSSESTHTAKQPPSKSRDPASNWMSSSPFGPAQTPKFSRLAIASPAVVMPLSAKEYRKRKAKGILGKGNEDVPSSSNRVTFIDNAASAFQNLSGVPQVKISPPPSEEALQLPSSPGDDTPDFRNQPQPQADVPSPKPFPPTPMPPRPSSPKQKRPRSRPNTPPRSSPLAAHPPISPKSSAGTFYSFGSSSDEETPRPKVADDLTTANSIRPASPQLRPRRKSYPDRLSSGARLSLVEAMNHLSQESTSPKRLSGASQTDDKRFSVSSQASGHTLFYDVVESELEQGEVTTGDMKGNGNADGDGDGARTPALQTQSLEDLSSTLTRTGIEIVRTSGDGGLGDLSADERKEKRNVRTVRISDTVEVSPSPVPRRRKLTKTRPAARESMSVIGAGPTPAAGATKETKVPTQPQPQTLERRASLLPWKSKGPNESKHGVFGAATGLALGERATLTPTKGLVHPNEVASTPVTPSPSPIPDRSAQVESQSKLKSNGTSPKKTSADTPASTPPTSPSPGPKSQPFAPLRKPRRYTFSFLHSAAFHRPKREKSNTTPSSVDHGLAQTSKVKGSVISMERSGTDSTSTSIRTVTQGSQSTLVPASPGVYDLTTLASSGLSGSMRGSSVPMLRRVNAQEMAMEGVGVPSPSEWEVKNGSTPSLITNGSTATTSSSPRTPSFARIGGTGGGEPFIPRPSALKESFMDIEEEDLEVESEGGRTSRCMHRRPESISLVHPGVGLGEVPEEDERHLRPGANPHAPPGSRPGTASSTLTTATETSESYLSLSTIPASTVSSASTSRSESPTPVGGDKQDRDRVVSVVQSEDGDEDEDIHTCALCGHRSTSTSPLPLPLSSRSRSPLSMRDLGLEGMHPMFTVPLVTVPASAFGSYSSLGSSAPTVVQGGDGGRDTGVRHSVGYVGGRKGERYTSVPVPTVGPAGVHVNVNSPLTSTKTKMATNDMMVTMTTPSPSPVPPSHKVKGRHRPQTAPAGTGDVALRFIEEARAMRAQEGRVDLDALIETECDRPPTKRKASHGESKFKAMFKGLLRWGA